MMEKTDESMKGAFFDVDYTVISQNSATLFVKYLKKEGWVGYPTCRCSGFSAARWP